MNFQAVIKKLIALIPMHKATLEEKLDQWETDIELMLSKMFADNTQAYEFKRDFNIYQNAQQRFDRKIALLQSLKNQIREFEIMYLRLMLESQRIRK